jgi:NADH:ubiquinone oxidoreductase subunit D
MARPRVVLDRSGVRALLRDAGVRAELARHMDRVVTVARANAPVDTGEYRDSIRRQSVTTDRAVERVVSSDPKALIVESRTGNLVRAFGVVGGD